MDNYSKTQGITSKALPKTITLEKELTDVLTKQLDECILRSQKYLLDAQYKEGYWSSELLVDPLTICDYILLLIGAGI